MAHFLCTATIADKAGIAVGGKLHTLLVNLDKSFDVGHTMGGCFADSSVVKGGIPNWRERNQTFC